MKALSFIFGLVAGTGLGIVASMRYFKKKADERADAEIEGMQNYYEHIYSTLRDRKTAEELSENLGYKESEPVEKEPEADAEEQKKITRESIMYEEMYKAQAKTQEESKPMTKPRYSLAGPKLIKAEDYGTDPAFDRMTLYYYTGNDVLINEEENPYEVEIAEYMIGDCLEKYNFKESSERSIYVRNAKYGCDYEIIKVPGNFEGD